MLATLEHNARELGLEVETAACDASELPFEDETFDLVLGHAVLHHLPDLDRASASSTASSSPAARCSSPASPPARATSSPRTPSGRRSRPRRCGARRSRRGPRRSTTAPTRTSTRSRPSSTSTRSSRPTSPSTPPRAASTDVEVQRRGAAGELVRLVQPHARGQRRAQGHPVGLDPVRLPGYILLQRVDRSAAGAAPAAADLLQPDARGAQARREPPPEEHPPGPFDMLRDPRAMVDTTVAPIAFVIVYAITKEVNPSAAVAVGDRRADRSSSGWSAASR